MGKSEYMDTCNSYTQKLLKLFYKIVLLYNDKLYI